MSRRNMKEKAFLQERPEKRKKILPLVLCVLASLFLIVAFLETLTFNLYHVFSRPSDYSVLLVLTQLLKIASYLLVPLAVFLHHRTSKNILRFLYPLVSVASLFCYSEYVSIVKTPENTPNLNHLDLVTLEIYDSINLFMPEWAIKSLFLAGDILLLLISVLLYFQDNIVGKDLLSLCYLPVVVLVTLPLNIFTEAVSKFPSDVYDFLVVDNFNFWHLLSFLLVFFMTVVLFYCLRPLSREKQDFYLQVLAIVLMIHFMSKNSMLIGDGYNVYNIIFSSIPLFICDIGKFLVFLAVFTRKKIFYDISFFVHSAGAVSVFFYFGRIQNFGTILNFSFPYFAITHMILFALAVLPRMLGHFTFRGRDAVVPALYYGVVIVLATITSVWITNLSATWTTASGEHLPELLELNFAFTQINPIPIELPDIWAITIGYCQVDFLYLLVLYLVYVLIFTVFFFFQKGVWKIWRLRNRHLLKRRCLPRQTNTI